MIIVKCDACTEAIESYWNLDIHRNTPESLTAKAHLCDRCADRVMTNLRLSPKIKIEEAQMSEPVSFSSPIPPMIGEKVTSMILFCPMCHSRHIEEGEFVTKKHHTHACQICGFVWRPAVEYTAGVKFLLGFKNA